MTSTFKQMIEVTAASARWATEHQPQFRDIELNPNLNAADVEPEPAVSPSLQREGHAYEMKFVVNAAVVANVVDWARRNMTPDPFARSAPAEGYLINTVYLDTPTFSTYYADPYFRTRKFRLRRYGDESVIWLEQKRKNKMRVRKRRISVSDSLLIERLTKRVDPEWDGAWFGQRLQSRQLQPVCRVSYRRLAYVGTTSTGPIRLTLDRSPVGVKSDDLTLTPVTDGTRLLADSVIVELKFLATSPLVFKELLATFRLTVCGVSKYRHCVNALSLCASPGDDDA